jgi:hypothetical protein
MDEERSEEPVDVVVAVDDRHVEQIHDVAARLKEQGLDVERTGNITGTVTGRVLRSKIRALKEVEGVSAVEESARFQLPSPESQVQ